MKLNAKDRRKWRDRGLRSGRRFAPIFWLASSFWILAVTGLQSVAASAASGATNGFDRQTITLPAKRMPSRFFCLGDEKRLDLLAVDQAGNRLLIYRQRDTGFRDTPDQILALPPQTGWISPCPIVTQTNLDLLVATVHGLVYYRQIDGQFESEPRVLVRAEQVFTNDDSPILISMPTNGSIPVISATQAVIYQRDRHQEWSMSASVTLKPGDYGWSEYPNAWTLGEQSAHTLTVNESWRARPNESDDEKPENDAIAKLLADLKGSGPEWSRPHSRSVDLDGDGKADFLVWQVNGEMDFKTDLYVYLRGADGKLPDRPTQVLHCRGFPFPTESTDQASPIADLKADGRKELVLLEHKSTIASASSLVDMALSRGVDMLVTIRSFGRSGFTRSAEASIPVTVLLSWYGSWQWPFFIHGDFNGDGRPDLLVQRSDERWEIFLSTRDDRWFERSPGMTFEVPMGGYFAHRTFEMTDLNGDGRADIVSRDRDDARLILFLSKPPQTKGAP